MSKVSFPSPIYGYSHPLIRDIPSLLLHDIENHWQIILDPENIFWSIVEKGRNISNLLREDILPIYNKRKELLDKDMERFRHDINLSAIYINVTDLCNADCIYCYIPQDMRRRGIQMSIDNINKALEQVEDYYSRNILEEGRRPVIIFHGSEPLLTKKEIFRVIESFSDRMLFGIQTNALALEREDVSFIKDYSVSIGLSLDSIDRENNRLSRPSYGNGDIFDSVVRALGWLGGYKGLNVVTTITKYNVRELPDIVRFLHDKGVGAALLNPVRCTADNTEALRPDCDLLYKYFKDAVDTAINLTVKTGQKIVVSSFTNIILAIVAPFARRIMCDISPCGGGRRFFTVMADGSTTPCGEFIGLADFHGANILENKIEDLLLSHPFFKIRARVVETIEGCKECIFRNICGAPCPAEVYSMTGEENTISPYCEFYKKIIEYAFKLIAEGRTQDLLRNELLENLEFEYHI